MKEQAYFQTRSEPEELSSKLSELEEASGVLKNALVTRNVEGIWKALSNQEKIVSWFYENLDSNTGATRGSGEKAQEHKSLIARIKRIQSTNKALASGFLKVIERTMSSLSEAQKTKTGTYGSSGVMSRINKPILVQQSG